MAGLFFLTFGLPDTMFRTAADKVEDLAADPNATNTLVSTAIYLLALALLVLRNWWIREGVRRDGLVLALVALSLTSTLWSVDPATTLRRSAALALSTVFAYYVASRFSLPAILRMLLVVLGIGTFLSIAWSLGRPDYGVDLDGQWLGITTHKNELARASVLTIITAVFVTPTLRWRLPGLIVAGAALFAMIMTRGTTAVVTLIALTALLPIWAAFRARKTMFGTVLVTLTAASVAAAWAVTTSFADMVQLTGKDVTLTGRTDLWAAVVHQIGEHPLLGHGYEAFWRGWDSPAGEVWLQVGWRTPHSHNGVLEMLLGLGALGGALFVALIVRGVSRSVNYVRNRPGPIAFFPVSCIAFAVLYSATEKGVVVQHSIYWVLLVIVLLAVGGSEGRLLQPGHDRRDRVVSDAAQRRLATRPATTRRSS